MTARQMTKSTLSACLGLPVECQFHHFNEPLWVDDFVVVICNVGGSIHHIQKLRACEMGIDLPAHRQYPRQIRYGPTDPALSNILIGKKWISLFCRHAAMRHGYIDPRVGRIRWTIPLRNAF